jgi:filamentous hemagglutinin
MNKQFYRTKFNAKLGTYVAVSELAKSHQGDTSPRIKASIHNDDVTASSIAATGQRTLKQLVLALSSLMAISPIYANVVVNNNAAAAHKATVLKEGNAANVWITAPSASGVSRNNYTQFDVNQNGVILNNSRGAATSQITKTSIAANPNLAKGAATTIVNEVVSTNPSLLQGNLEVLGSRANVVIANPTGITVNGGGFINANQVTLSTGVLGYNSDGSMKDHTVKQGAITINLDANNRGLGGNANNPVALELLGRSIAINAPVNATAITAVTGANTIAADTGAFTATTGTGTVPTVAIDVAQLGGIYANSIYLHANDVGVGVNNAGMIKATNNLVLSSNGKITNTATGLLQTTDATNGLMSVQSNRTDGHGDIVNQGKIQSANALFVDAGRHLYLQQDSYTGVTSTASQNIVSLNAKGAVVGTGAVIKQIGDGKDIYINVDGDISLTGKQASGIQNNIGSNGGVYLSAGQKIKITDASIISRNDLDISSNKQLDLKDSSIYSRDTGIYINSVGTDIANAAINVTNAVLDANTKLAIQSSGLLNLTDLSLPIASGQTSTRVQDVVFTAQQNLNFNQNKQMLQPIKGKLSIAAAGDVSVATGLTGANVEVKGLGGVDIEGANIKTKNIKLSTAGNLNIAAQKDVNLQDNTSLWASSGNINVSALGGNLTTTSLTALANKGKVSLLADKDVRLNIAKINSAVDGTTALDQTNQKSKITAGQDINIGSTNQGALYLYAGDIQSTAGNINLIADKNINLYRADDVKQVKNADGTFTPKTTYLWSELKAKDISVKSATGNVELQWLNANATNDLVVDAKGFNRIYGGELKSGRNIELHGGDNVRLWAVKSNSGAHTAVSSDKNIYLNSDIDANGQTSWAAASTVNMTAGGLLSLKSKGLQAHQRINLKGGAINIEAGTSLDWKDQYTLTAVDSAILKNNADLAQFNGDIGIQTGTGNLTITPTNITLNAYGDIDLRTKGGDLTLVGIGGTQGNGSEQVVKLNTATGGISLAGKKVEL